MPRLDERTAHFLYTVLLILLGYFCLGWTCTYGFNYSVYHPLDLYFLPSFFLMFFFLCRSLVKEGALKLTPKLEKNEGWSLLLIALVFVLTRIMKFDEMGVWLDEYTQFIYGAQLEGSSLIEYSFYEQQPPLDYMLSGFSKMVWGENVFALKFHVFLFSILFYLLLPFCLRILTSKVIPRYSVVFILLMCRPLMFYSMEARPLILSLLFSLLSLTFLLNCLSTNKKSDALITLITFLLFTNTTGLQPQIFLLLICLCFTGFSKSQKWLPIGLGALAFVYNVPILYFLVKYTERTNQFSTEVFENTSLMFSRQGLGALGSALYRDPYLLVALSGVIGILALISFVNEKNRKQRRLECSLVILPFFYIFLYCFVYYSFISWHFSIRYTYNFFSLFAFFLLIGLIYLFDLKKTKAVTALKYGLTLLFLWGSVRVIAHPFKWYLAAAERPEWEPIYQSLNKRMRQDDYLLRFTLANLGDWRGGRYVGELFYANSLVREKTLRTSYFSEEVLDEVFCDHLTNYLKPRSGKVFFLIDKKRLPEGTTSIEVDSKKFKKVEGLKYLNLYSYEVSTNLFQTLKEYFELVIAKDLRNEANMPLLESLFCLESKFGTKEDYFKYLLTYQNLEVTGDRVKSGMYLNKKNEFEKRKKYFLDLMDERWK